MGVGGAGGEGSFASNAHEAIQLTICFFQLVQDPDGAVNLLKRQMTPHARENFFGSLGTSTTVNHLAHRSQIAHKIPPPPGRARCRLLRRSYPHMPTVESSAALRIQCPWDSYSRSIFRIS